MIQCAKCNRPLKTEESRKRGYGAICWAKVQAEWEREKQLQEADIEIQATVRNGYAGARGPDGAVKVVAIRNGQQYPLRHLVHHSPSGFEWGYGGSGPADLARSIIGDALGISDPHPAIYQEFKRSFVAGWGDRWEISLEEVREWIQHSMKEVSGT